MLGNQRAMRGLLKSPQAQTTPGISAGNAAYQAVRALSKGGKALEFLVSLSSDPFPDSSI
jgi:hypothetical protein